MDGDGDLDVLGAAFVADDMSIWYNAVPEMSVLISQKEKKKTRSLYGSRRFWLDNVCWKCRPILLPNPIRLIKGKSKAG